MYIRFFYTQFLILIFLPKTFYPSRIVYQKTKLLGPHEVSSIVLSALCSLKTVYFFKTTEGEF